MFRDLKEYQEIAKIYAEKVSKPENLEERRGSSVQQLAQNRANAFKPATPPQGGAGGGVGNPTNVRGSGAKPRPKPQVNKLPSTAQIRAANPNAVGGGNAGGSTDSGGTSKSTIKSVEQKPTPTPTTGGGAATTQAKPQSKFIKKDKGVGFVKRGTPGAQRAENLEKNKNRAKEMAKARIAAKKDGTASPQMSGKEKAQAMAKARLAAKNKPAAGESAPKAAGAAGGTAPKAAGAAGGSTAGGGASATKKIDGKGLASKMGAEKSASSSSSNTVPSGSFGISAKGKEQAAKNKAEVANKKTSGDTSAINASATKKQMSPLMQKRLAATKVGENAAKEINKIKPKPGQTVTTKTSNDGSTSSKVTTGTGGGTAGATGSAGSLEANKKKAAKMKEMEAKRNAMEKEFEIPESNELDAYDLVLDYLLSSEQVATIEEANYVMTEMDAETIQGIVEEQKKNLDEIAPAVAGVVAAGTLGVMGLNAIRKMNKNKKKMDKGEKFTPNSTMDNIQKKKDLYKQMGITKQYETHY